MIIIFTKFDTKIEGIGNPTEALSPYMMTPLTNVILSILYPRPDLWFLSLQTQEVLCLMSNQPQSYISQNLEVINEDKENTPLIQQHIIISTLTYNLHIDDLLW